MAQQSTSHGIPSVLTVAETAKALRVHEDSVRRWIEAGTLEAYRLPGGTYRIPVEAVDGLKLKKEGGQDRDTKN